MNADCKPAEDLTPEDFAIYPVWEFINDDELGETVMQPVRNKRVAHLNGRLVGTQVCLANGRSVWAMIGNVNAAHAQSTQHFLTLSVWHKKKWFHLARYFDVDYAKRGPKALAKALSLPVESVFPIHYDLTSLSRGEVSVLRGTIEKVPKEQLSRMEIMRLAISPQE
jgi:hypothetical protein